MPSTRGSGEFSRKNDAPRSSSESQKRNALSYDKIAGHAASISSSETNKGEVQVTSDTNYSKQQINKFEQKIHAEGSSSKYMIDEFEQLQLGETAEKNSHQEQNNLFTAIEIARIQAEFNQRKFSLEVLQGKKLLVEVKAKHLDEPKDTPFARNLARIDKEFNEGKFKSDVLKDKVALIETNSNYLDYYDRGVDFASQIVEPFTTWETHSFLGACQEYFSARKAFEDRHSGDSTSRTNQNDSSQIAQERVLEILNSYKQPVDIAFSKADFRMNDARALGFVSIAYELMKKHVPEIKAWNKVAKINSNDFINKAKEKVVEATKRLQDTTQKLSELEVANMLQLNE